MNLDLRATIQSLRAAGKLPRRMPRMPRPRPPITVERDYYRKLKAVLDQAKALVDQRLGHVLARIAGEQVKHDASDYNPGGAPRPRLIGTADEWEITQTIGDIKVSYYQQGHERWWKATADEMGHRIAVKNRTEVLKPIKAVIGIDPLQSEPWLIPKINQFTTTNVALIKSIPEQYFGDIEKKVREGVLSGRRVEDLQAEIQERYEVSKSRAALIARDQVGKFYGALTKERQTNLGISNYIWRTSQDERVRDSHARMEGKYCQWDDPTVWSDDGITWEQRPSDVPSLHPGIDYQCRCTAEPVIDELEEL